jgi:hypothetical protein
VCLLQDAGLKVKEYELIRKNFSDSGNFGEQQRLAAAAAGELTASISSSSTGQQQQQPAAVVVLVASGSQQEQQQLILVADQPIELSRCNSIISSRRKHYFCWQVVYTRIQLQVHCDAYKRQQE